MKNRQGGEELHSKYRKANAEEVHVKFSILFQVSTSLVTFKTL